MRALIQRVKGAKVVVDGKTVGEIGPGILTFLGVGANDTEAEVDRVVGKIAKLRIFEDAEGKMNLSLLDLQGSAGGGPAHGHLIVSQFTLYGELAKGNRPSFVDAAKPALARALYEKALAASRALGLPTAGGTFQAHMEVSLLNDGPVTFMLET